MKLLIILLLICILLYIIQTKISTDKQDTIFTCTTYFDYEKEDKWNVFCRAMDSILQKHSKETLHRVKTWVVVNEYSDTPKQVWTKRVRERYPFITFIQKDASKKGQANSLNIILDWIKPYTYWIQWEESWYVETPCFDTAFSIMDSTNITQLQMTNNWLNIDKESIHCKSQYCIIDQTKNLKEISTWSPYHLFDYPNWVHSWPRYSLLPSINRVSFYTFGKFPIDPALWPIKFEWDFAIRWANLGGVKAVLIGGPVIRSKSHKSTYS